MKYVIVTLFVALCAGCGAKGPKVIPTLRDGMPGFETRCYGTGRSFNDCYYDAKKHCPSGFDVIDREQSSNEEVVRRILSYRCKQ